MTWLQAILLGAIQGLTEFLPISSSGHLVIVPWLFEWEIDPGVLFSFTIVLHWGTLLALVAAFWKELRLLLAAFVAGLLARDPFGNSTSILAWLLLLASVPAAVAGLLLGDFVEQAFARPEFVAILLLLNAAVLSFGEWMRRRRRSASVKIDLDSLSRSDALVIGFAQILALFPGISRSGSTIAAGLTRGLSRVEAARFSFLLAVPIMIGAGLIALRDLSGEGAAASVGAEYLIGFASAAVVGFVTIRWFLDYLSRGSLWAFALYCVIVAAFSALIGVLRA